jgi:hypothetical protein
MLRQILFTIAVDTAGQDDDRLEESLIANDVADELRAKPRKPGSFEQRPALDRFRIYPMEVSLPTVHADPDSEPSQRSRWRLTRAR